MNYAKLFKQIRKKNKFTQMQLASLIGCTQANISQIEKGIYSPSMELLSVVADVTNTSIIEMLKYALKHKNK